jgi:hypothetical protein
MWYVRGPGRRSWTVTDQGQWNNKSPNEITGAFSKLVDQMRASKPTMKILVSRVLTDRTFLLATVQA